MELNEACVEDVAAHLDREVSADAMERFEVMKRLVAIAEKHGGDCGLALLAGVWLAGGMPEHEIIARCWPQHRRFAVINGDSGAPPENG